MNGKTRIIFGQSSKILNIIYCFSDLRKTLRSSWEMHKTEYLFM